MADLCAAEILRGSDNIDLRIDSPMAVLFGLLIAEPTATLFAALLRKTAISAIIASALCLVVNLRRAPWVTGEYAVLVATALVTPPLIYFVIYFCALHSNFCALRSPRHFLLTADQLRLTPMQGLRAALPILIATLTMTALCVMVLAVFNPALEPATVQIVFIGLAAITVPHMLLTAVFRSVH